MFYVAVNGVQQGPLPEDEVRRRITGGDLKTSDLCWREGWAEWRKVGAAFPELIPAPPIAANRPPQLSPARPTTSGLAVASLVCGIAGLLLLPVFFLLSVPAVICGHLASAQIKRAGQALSGEGMALAGKILGYITIGLFVLIAGLVALAVPAFQKVRTHAQEQTVRNNLRQFVAAAQQHMMEHDVKQATYDDLVGPEPGKYIRQLRPVAGENYRDLVYHADDRVIQVRLRNGRIVEYRP